MRMSCCQITARVRVPMATDDHAADVLATRVERTCGARHELGDVVVLADEPVPAEPRRPTPRRPRPHVTPAPEPVVSVVAIGAAGRWWCGHEARIATATTARDPAALVAATAIVEQIPVVTQDDDYDAVPGVQDIRV